MNKYEFLEQLKKQLKTRPNRDVNERINFYEEMIDDRIEEGLTEEEAVLAVGTVEEIALQITEEIQAAKTEKITPTKRKLRAWEIALLILGAPLWGSLLIIAFAVGFILYAVLWTLNAVLWAIELPFFLFYWISKGLLPACMATSKGSWLLTKKACGFIKKIFSAKE